MINFYDSNSGDENAPVYNWVEISDVGTNLGLTDDSHINDVGIGFGFPYYGEVFNSMTVCSNGWASFLPCFDGDNNGECNSLSHFFNNSITHPIGPYGMLAPFYDDLDDNNGAEPLDVYSFQDVDNNRFIIQWNNIANGQHDEDCIPGDDSSCPKETFQLILSSNGEILFQYKEINDVDDHGCTIGIESPNKDEGVEYIFFNQQAENASGLTNEMAIKFVPTSLNIEYERIPQTYSFLNNYPNPFNPSTTIKYFLPNHSEIQLTVFDHLGREVKQLEHKFQEPGIHYINWDGRNKYGINVSSGIYIYQITYDGTTQTGKMLLVK